MIFGWAGVVAQLVVWLFPMQQIRGSNPVILFKVHCIEKTKIKKKETGNGSNVTNGHLYTYFVCFKAMLLFGHQNVTEI